MPLAESQITQALEIRLVRLRLVRIPVVVVFVRVFGADRFVERIAARYIGQRRGKWRGEDAFVLDRHMHLQELAPMLAEYIPGEHPILFGVPFESVLHL